MARRLDACLVAVVGFAAVFLARQGTFYKDDGHQYLMHILEGQVQHPHHLLYKPLVLWLHRATAPLGASLYDAGLLASALGTGLGLGCACLASRRLGLDRRAAFAVAALMLTVPALFFFGTVVELHGVFLGFAGPSFIAAAALACTPTPGHGLALGGALSLAYVGHASAGLLPAVLLPLALFYPTRAATWARARELLVPVALAGAVLAGFLFALPAVGRLTGLGVDSVSAAAYVVRDALAFAGDPQRWWTTLLYEWLAPYAPLHLLALACCVRGAWRGQARWLLLAVVPYYLLCVLLLPSAEFGAYLTPFAWPLALLAVRAVPRSLVLACGAVGLAGGITWVTTHDRPELAQRFAAGVAAAAGDRAPFLLLGGHADVKATLIALPHVPHVLVLHASAVPAADLPAVMQLLDDRLRARWAEGCAVLLTDGAAAMLEQLRPSGPLVVPALRERYRLERVDLAGDAPFAGWRVSAR